MMTQIKSGTLGIDTIAGAMGFNTKPKTKNTLET
jgi:hypothetical protein